MNDDGLYSSPHVAHILHLDYITNDDANHTTLEVVYSISNSSICFHRKIAPSHTTGLQMITSLVLHSRITTPRYILI